jgi:hypothetical protein
MKAGCMEVKYDLASVSVTERDAMQNELITLVAKYGFEVYSMGGSCVPCEMDILFCKNIKASRREVNEQEAKEKPAKVIKAKVAVKIEKKG